MSTDFKAWIGKSETIADTVTATLYAALAATLDRPAQRPAAGTPLPALWQAPAKQTWERTWVPDDVFLFR